MKKEKWLFSSESVTEGHPDKMCDQISDAILDAILKEDPYARVACETVTKTGMVLVCGEITTNCYIDIQKTVRNTIKEIGYTEAVTGFDYENCAVLTSIDEQSPDIAMGVDLALESKENSDVEQIGAGDQGMMFGYACNETEELMPLPIVLAHKLCKRLAEVRKKNIIDRILPDGKAQVTVVYEDNKPVYIDTIVISTQHEESFDQAELRQAIIDEVINPVLVGYPMDENTKILVNPTGRFVIGGPRGDSGLTGRKIIVDTYGGMAAHGGGAFSGKDPTKVDRSACYAARYIAKNLVAAGAMDRCEIQLAYAIGVASPVSIYVQDFGTGRLPNEKIIEIIQKHFPLKPLDIIEKLDLRKPIYKQVAAYGHFGRNDLDLSWEKLDLVDTIKTYLD